VSHFYTKTASGIEPRHFVPMAKDPSRLRASTVSDAKKARKNGEIWCPSVTTVLGILDKPALNNWGIDEHLKTAFELLCDISYQNNTAENYLENVKRITQERLDAAPKAGTEIHQVLEVFMRDGIEPEGEIEKKICHNVRDKLLDVCGEQKWECEKYFVAEEGYAGCADLVSGEWVIDYKTKQTKDKFKPGKMAYPEHARQLAAYQSGLPDVSGYCANIFICLETGEIDFYEHSIDAISDGWLDFLDCLSIYKRNNFNPLEG